MGLKEKIWAICLLCLSSLTGKALSRPYFNVINYGAKADGKTDMSQALINAWKVACASKVSSTILIPKGRFLLGPVLLVGPCRSQIEFRNEGIVMAPMNPVIFKRGSWINFRYITGLTISGGGIFDGRGQVAWAKNDCKRNPHCQQLPISFRFDFMKNTLVKDITSLNSKNFHMNLFKCQGMIMQNIKIKAPGDSPNTDGIHIGDSSFISITHSVIGTGDDCISLGPGSRNISITNVFCGPGHGISIGSLGKYQNEEDVVGITVRDCTLSGTTNGLRIKTWPDSPPGFASDITFENIIVKNVYNPVIVDQEYCPYYKCDQKGPSLVKLKNVKFSNIRGTSASNLAVKIVGSKAAPVELQIGDINLLYYGKEGPATSMCYNAKAYLSGSGGSFINNGTGPCPYWVVAIFGLSLGVLRLAESLAETDHFVSPEKEGNITGLEGYSHVACLVDWLLSQLIQPSTTS